MGFTLPAEEKGKNERNAKKSMKSGNIRLAVSAHKTTVLKRTEQLKSYSEGDSISANSASHIEIRYTDLFVTEDNDLVDSSRHEYFDLASRRARIYVHQDCQRIRPCHLLTPREGSGRPPKRVKVKGIAGIGKSVAVQRLLYEWAIGKNMREFDCVLRFRELNLVSEPVSMLELLGDRFRYLKEVLEDLFLSPSSILFVLDGLDEFKFPLKWNDQAKDIGIKSKVQVSELMVALIEGSLLPESSVILTTRPSTEAPKQFFQRCCIVLGFEEKQVKEYTYKFYKNIEVADKVYDYILNNDNLFVLSFIPLYCYIICTAMAEFFSLEKQDDDASRSLELNPPKTRAEPLRTHPTPLRVSLLEVQLLRQTGSHFGILNFEIKRMQVKKLFMCGNNLGPEGVLELWNALEHNTTVEELVVGNDIGEEGRRRLMQLQRSRPELQVIANFVDDIGLLQAYLDWVEEIQADRDQMESVKNADGLLSVLKGLQVAGEVQKAENAQKARELQMKITQLLESIKG
ncbi:hypothetical protein WMY93_026626 [Mugilogobius chulae]|uniref:NACHT domain-containing protein n=1 Tax=Mugilogobius chulae TaxID=88201 RepID=A0AAW0N3R5_9GOBI